MVGLGGRFSGTILNLCTTLPFRSLKIPVSSTSQLSSATLAIDCFMKKVPERKSNRSAW